MDGFHSESLMGLSVERDSEAASERFKNGRLDRLAGRTTAQKKQSQGAG